MTNIPYIIGRGTYLVVLSSPECFGVLPTFFKMEFCPPIDFDLKTDRQLKQLTEEVPKLIKGWQANNYSMPRIELWDARESNENSWPSSELFYYLYHLERRVQVKLTNVNIGGIEVFVGRPSDGRVLCIRHERSTLRMYDAIPSGNNESWEFDEWNS